MISNWKEYWKKLLHQSAKKIDDELFKGTIYLLNNLTIPQTDVKTLISFLSCLEGIASFNTFRSAWFTTLLAIVTCYCLWINMRIQDAKITCNFWGEEDETTEHPFWECKLISNSILDTWAGYPWNSTLFLLKNIHFLWGYVFKHPYKFILFMLSVSINRK